VEWIVPDGKSCPGWHWGQVEHPNPEPLPRTRPPTLKSTTVVTAVTVASVANRVDEVGVEVMEGSGAMIVNVVPRRVRDTCPP